MNFKSFINKRNHIQHAAKLAVFQSALITVIAVTPTSSAFAQSLQPVASVLQTLISILTGPIASMIAILAVISCGFLAWTGRFTWGVAGSVIMGIVLVFGSTQIVAFFQNALGNTDVINDDAPDLIPLVKALTKAPTLFGVPYMFVMFNIVVTAVVFLATKNLLTLLLVLPIHSLGYFLSLIDDQIFMIVKVKMSKTPPRSKTVWQIKSYAPGDNP